MGRVVVVGPLAVFGEGLRRYLAGRGYALDTIVDHVHLLDDLSGWLSAQNMTAADLTERVAEEFLRARRAAGAALARPLHFPGAGASATLTFVRFAYYAKLSPARQAIYRESDAIATLALPGGIRVADSVHGIREGLARGHRAMVQKGSQALIDALAEGFDVPPVETRSTPSATSFLARSTSPVLSETEISARVTATRSGTVLGAALGGDILRLQRLAGGAIAPSDES